MIASEPISVVAKGDRIVLPVAVAPYCGLPGLAAGEHVTVVESFAGEIPGQWVLHVTDEIVTRTLGLSDEALILVDA